MQPRNPDLPADAPSRPEPRARSARRALIGAGLLGVFADLLLRNGEWGLGLLAWVALFAVVLVTLRRWGGHSLSRESMLWLSLAVLSAAGLSWRDAEALFLLDMMAMLAALVLLAMSLNRIPVAGIAVARIRDLVVAAVGTGIEVAVGVLPLIANDAALNAVHATVRTTRARRITRALLITVPLVIAFTFLLVNADPLFGSFVKLPDIAFDVVASHILLTGFFAWIVAGWLRRSLLDRPSVAAIALPDTTAPFSLGSTDLTLALGALNVLFAAFVAVQVGWLFGGEALVQRTTGLGYAEYARRGFFELMWVAGLLLAVLLGAQAMIASTDRVALTRFRRLAVPLVLLLGAILGSAGARMQLYIRYYGLSTDRLYASTIMIWLALVFVWLLFTVLRARPRTFAAGLVLSGYAVLLTLNALGPDGLVARVNLAREGGATDYRYLATLGGDAMPALVSTLTNTTAIATDSVRALDRCTAVGIVLNRWAGDRRDQLDASWTSWNAGRRRALEAVRGHESALRQLTCPKPPAPAPAGPPVANVPTGG